MALDKRKTMREHLDALIEELYRLRKQEGWKNKGLPETQVPLIQARAMLAAGRKT